MYKLCVLDCDNLDNELVCSFSDLINGFVKYKDEAEKRDIEIIYEKNKRTDEIIQRNDKIDCFMSIWGAMVDTNSDIYKNRKFKTITFLDDVHWWTEQSLKDRINFFEKTDIIFTPYARTAKTYLQYSHLYSKFQTLHWWAPDSCFSFNEQWKNRKDKILLSGSIQMYPIRKAISENLDVEVEQLKHSLRYPKFIHEYHGEKYYEYLSKYKGAIATSCAKHATEYDKTIVHALDYTLSKNFEILGCGCLGFLEETDDFNELQLKPYEHYIPITLLTYKQQWKYLQDKNSELIAKKGHELVKATHSTKNRIIQILDMIQTL